MSEEAVSQEVTDPVESLPNDQQMDFSSALDAAFSALSNPESAPEPEPQSESESEPEPEPEPEPEVESVEQVKEEPEVEQDKKEDLKDLESFDPTDELDSDIGDDWTPKAAARFKKLKAELKASTDSLEEMRQQATQNESKVKELSGELNSSDVEEMQQKLEEYEKQKMFSDLENTEAYKTAVAEPLDSLINTTREIAEKYEIDPEDLVEALAIQNSGEQDEKITELMENTTDRDRARIYRVIEDIGPILDKRVNLLENAEEALNEANLAAERNVEIKAAEKAKERQNAAKNVVARVQQKLPFLNGLEGIDMSEIQAKAAELDPTIIHPVDYTYNSVSAQILPAIVKEYASMRRENEQLTDRLAEYEEAEPSMSGSTPNKSHVSDDLSFADRIEAAFSSKM